MTLHASSDYRGKLRLLFTVHGPDFLRRQDRAGFWDKRPSPSTSTLEFPLSSAFTQHCSVECGQELTEEASDGETASVASAATSEDSVKQRRISADALSLKTPYKGPTALANPPALTRPAFVDLLKVGSFFL